MSQALTNITQFDLPDNLQALSLATDKGIGTQTDESHHQFVMMK